MKIPPPSEFVQYDINKKDKLPHISDYIIGQSNEIASYINQKPPNNVNEVILHAIPFMIDRYGSVEFFVYGSFRSHFRMIDSFADYLIPFYLQTGILPIVRPLTRYDWQSNYMNKGPAYLRISKSGILLNRLGELYG